MRKTGTEEVARVGKIVKLYREAILHAKRFNSLCAPLKAALHVIITTCTIICLYGCVRIEGWFKFAMVYIASFCLTVYILMCSSYGGINSRCSELLECLTMLTVEEYVIGMPLAVISWHKQIINRKISPPKKGDGCNST